MAEGLRGRGHETWVLTGRGTARPPSRELHPELDLDLEALAARHLEGGLPPAGGLAASLRRHIFNPQSFRACLRQIRALRPQLVSFWNLSWVSPSPLLAARVTGVPAALAAAMLRLHRDPALAGRLAERGQRRAREKSGFEPFLARLEELYRRAADLPPEDGARRGGP